MESMFNYWKTRLQNTTQKTKLVSTQAPTNPPSKPRGDIMSSIKGIKTSKKKNIAGYKYLFDVSNPGLLSKEIEIEKTI